MITFIKFSHLIKRIYIFYQILAIFLPQPMSKPTTQHPIQKQTSTLRNQFLHSNIQILPSSQDDQKQNSQNSGQQQSQKSQQDCSSNFTSSLKINQQFPKSIHDQQTYQQIIRNSKNWNPIQFQENENNQQQQINYLPQVRSTQKFSNNPNSQSHHICGKKSKQQTINSSVEALNYKTVLKSEIKKNQALERSLQKRDKKIGYMQELIKKLKQQNRLLRKYMNKQISISKPSFDSQQSKVNRKAKYYKWEESPSNLSSMMCHHSYLNSYIK